MAQDWDNFAVITGGAAAALAGLIFVAVSINRERIAQHAAVRAQAGQTLVLFSLPLLAAILLVLPGLSGPALGGGLVALGLLVAAAMVLIGHGKDPRGDGPLDALARLVDRASPNLVVTALLLVGGGLQLAGEDGLYWIAGSSTLSLIGGVSNAWLFLTRS